MSKPLVVAELVSPAINMHTTLGSGAVVLTDTPALLGPVVSISTNLFNKPIVLTNDPTAEVKLDGGNVFVTASNGNVGVSAGGSISETAAFTRQSMLVVTRTPTTVDPAAAVYNQFDNGSAPGIAQLSRINVVPDALGTTINSIVVNPGNPNQDGQEIWFQNLGSAPGQTLTLTNLSGAGTAGGLLRTSGVGYVVQPGGGVGIMFDETVTADGAWLVRGI